MLATAPLTLLRHRAAARVRRLRLPAVVLVAAGLRLWLVAAGVVPFNADEAVVGLMARHILQGERPVFFYGQAYLGSLDAWLIAGAFAVVGESVWAIRLVQVLLLAGTLATTYALGHQIFRSEWVAGAAALFLAVPPVLVTLYTTVSLGGYGEALLLGNLVLLVGLALVEQPLGRAGHWLWLALGALVGLGVWTMPLVLVYALPVALLLAWTHRARMRGLLSRWALAAIGLAVGASPWLLYTARHGAITLLEAGGSVVAGASPPHPLLAALQHLLFLMLFGVTVVWGLRPPWSAHFLALPLVPFALAIHMGAWGRALRQALASPGRVLLAGTAATLSLAYILTAFGADPSGRYFLPLAVISALYVADLLHWLRLRRRTRRTVWRKWFAQCLAMVLLAFFWWGNVQSAVAFPPGITTQFASVAQVDQRALADVAAFLTAKGETRGYTNYWVTYPLAFASREALIFAPSLPYLPEFRYTPRDNRYAPYSDAVAESPRVAYISTRYPALEAHLRQGLIRQQVSFQEATFGDFHLFYALSRRVEPAELGLGACCDD